jgi:hypothetical protein
MGNKKESKYSVKLGGMIDFTIAHAVAGNEAAKQAIINDIVDNVLVSQFVLETERGYNTRRDKMEISLIALLSTKERNGWFKSLWPELLPKIKDSSQLIKDLISRTWEQRDIEGLKIILSFSLLDVDHDSRIVEKFADHINSINYNESEVKFLSFQKNWHDAMAEVIGAIPANKFKRKPDDNTIDYSRLTDIQLSNWVCEELFVMSKNQGTKKAMQWLEKMNCINISVDTARYVARNAIIKEAGWGKCESNYMLPVEVVLQTLEELLVSLKISKNKIASEKAKVICLVAEDAARNLNEKRSREKYANENLAIIKKLIEIDESKEKTMTIAKVSKILLGSAIQNNFEQLLNVQKNEANKLLSDLWMSVDEKEKDKIVKDIRKDSGNMDVNELDAKILKFSFTSNQDRKANKKSI